MPDMDAIKALAEGQALESTRAQDAALAELDYLIETAQRVRATVLAGSVPTVARVAALLAMAGKAQREIDAMRAATGVADTLTAALRATSEPEGKPLGIVPTGEPFRFAPGGTIHAIESWYGTADNRLMEVVLIERYGPAADLKWRQIGVRKLSTDTVVYPVREG